MIIVRENRTESTRDESKQSDAREHDEHAVEALDLGDCADVSIADCRDGRHNEIDSHAVSANIVKLIVRRVFFLPASCVTVQISNENIQAAKDVHKEEEEDEEEEQAFHTRINLHLLSELAHHGALRLQNLEHLGQSGHSDQLVQLSNFSETDQDIDFKIGHQVKWQD